MSEFDLMKHLVCEDVPTLYFGGYRVVDVSTHSHSQFIAIKKGETWFESAGTHCEAWQKCKDHAAISEREKGTP